MRREEALGGGARRRHGRPRLGLDVVVFDLLSRGVERVVLHAGAVDGGVLTVENNGFPLCLKKA